MKAIALSIPGAFLLESPVQQDSRGFFREWFKVPDLEMAGVDFQVRQANLSHSIKDVVRGLHYSLAPDGQAKVVTCVLGAIDEVIVDIRVGSPTFGQCEYLTLAAEEGSSVVVPGGTAHGFRVCGESASIAYLYSSPYQPAVELGIDPFDAELAVPWRLSGPAVMSERDQLSPSLAVRKAQDQLPQFSL